MRSRLRSDPQTALLAAALLVGLGTAVARDLDTRAGRDARAANLVAKSTAGGRLHPEAAAALAVARGSRAPEHVGGLAGLIRDPSRPRQVSVATAAQALVLGIPGAEADAPANARLVADVRAGGAVPDTAWSTVGVAGLVALEAGRAGRADLVPVLVSVGSEGPSEPDRLAAKWALGRLGYDPDGRAVRESPASRVAQ